jgi:HrpA-like RNA helicase
MVDEIHERGRDEDFLLIVLRDILPKRPDLRLVRISLTLKP